MNKLEKLIPRTSAAPTLKMATHSCQYHGRDYTMHLHLWKHPPAADERRHCENVCDCPIN